MACEAIVKGQEEGGVREVKGVGKRNCYYEEEYYHYYYYYYYYSLLLLLFVCDEDVSRGKVCDCGVVNFNVND